MNDTPAVFFFSEDIVFSPEHPEKLAEWVVTCITKHNFILQELNFIFTSDEYLHRINLQYLNHDNYTDIITFDNSNEDNEIEGDVFISINRVKENSENLNIPFLQELYRVMIHGVLHLVGYKDKTPEEKIIMRKKEDACLSLNLDDVSRENN